jgi:hypothetical protein
MTEFCTHSIRVPRAGHWNWREATYTSQNVASSFMIIATGSRKKWVGGGACTADPSEFEMVAGNRLSYIIVRRPLSCRPGSPVQYTRPIQR